MGGRISARKMPALGMGKEHTHRQDLCYLRNTFITKFTDFQLKYKTVIEGLCEQLHHLWQQIPDVMLYRPKLTAENYDGQHGTQRPRPSALLRETSGPLGASTLSGADTHITQKC